MLPSPRSTDCQHISQLSRTLMKIEDEDPDFPKNPKTRSENYLISIFFGESRFLDVSQLFIFFVSEIFKKNLLYPYVVKDASLRGYS